MKTQPRNITLTRNGLTVQCAFGPDGRLERKTERLNGSTGKFTYEFDAKGHLLEVRRGDSFVEIYHYNAKGQRTMQRCTYGGLDESIAREYEYDDAGRLVQAGEISFAYDRNGALCQRRDPRGATFFNYGNDTRLDTVTLPGGGEIRYEYDQANPLNPARRFKNGRLTHQYAWRDPLRLYACLDHDAGVEYQFTYDREGRLDRLRLFNLGIAGERADPGFADRFLDDRERARRDALRGFFANGSMSLELLCCTDQVGTLRALIKAGTLSANSWTIADNIAEAYAKCDPHKLAHHMPTGAPNRNGELTGWAVKQIQRDSFGNPHYDSFPDFFPPIGFAGGLEDPDTGLVRFGWRDYDPAVGRFTAPDPLGDTGGDHDLYDYCVDDPVTMSDPTGLHPAWLLYAAGKALALGIAGAGTYGAASLVGSEAVDGVNEIFPMVAGIQAVTAAPAVAVAGAQALAPLVRQAGTALWSNAQRTAAPIAQRAGEMANDAWQRFGPAVAVATGAAAPNTNAERWLRRGVEALEGGAVPIPPHGGSLPGQLGGAAVEIGKQAWRIYEQERRRQELNEK